jgi:hypothetical protein
MKILGPPTSKTQPFLAGEITALLAIKHRCGSTQVYPTTWDAQKGPLHSRVTPAGGENSAATIVAQRCYPRGARGYMARRVRNDDYSFVAYRD